jgi:hypothetical protein
MPVVGLFRRRVPDPLPVVLALGLPRLDGAGWPDRAQAGRGASFDARTLFELGQRNAYEPEAHTVGDLLVEAALPRLGTGVSAADAPYLRQVYSTAARMGAGLAMVGRTLPDAGEDAVDRRLAGALWQARRALPAMPPEREAVAAWFLLAGFHLGRGGPPRSVEVLAALVAELA